MYRVIACGVANNPSVADGERPLQNKCLPADSFCILDYLLCIFLPDLDNK